MGVLGIELNSFLPHSYWVEIDISFIAMCGIAIPPIRVKIEI